MQISGNLEGTAEGVLMLLLFMLLLLRSHNNIGSAQNNIWCGSRATLNGAFCLHILLLLLPMRTSSLTNLQLLIIKNHAGLGPPTFAEQK